MQRQSKSNKNKVLLLYNHVCLGLLSIECPLIIRYVLACVIDSLCQIGGGPNGEVTLP